MPDTCATCARLARRDAGDAPNWDAIYRTPAWDVVHAFDTALPGWLVLVVRRHITAVADLDDAEAAALGPLLAAVSRALHEVVGCTKTYVVQFAESRQHRHVHVHVIPRHQDQPAEQRGPGVFRLLGVAPEERVTEARMDEIATRVRAILEGS
jgi:diadenosine tetraphosphate (Ap4A) HIT family hydrolase